MVKKAKMASFWLILAQNKILMKNVHFGQRDWLCNSLWWWRGDPVKMLVSVWEELRHLPPDVNYGRSFITCPPTLFRPDFTFLHDRMGIPLQPMRLIAYPRKPIDNVHSCWWRSVNTGDCAGHQSWSSAVSDWTSDRQYGFGGQTRLQYQVSTAASDYLFRLLLI